MAKISNPTTFSSHFKISPKLLSKLGVLDPSLNVDTKLFIDPFLLAQSRHREIAKGGRSTYEKRFKTVISFLSKSKVKEDVAWRSARRLMEFPEVKYTCLGYGAASVSGSGSGAFTTDGVMGTAKEIVDLGVEDPDLFVAMGLFEEGIGPDRISDMTANVILPDLLAFNKRVLPKLKVPTKTVTIRLRNGDAYTADLPINPFETVETPIILVPTDILRRLPIVTSWSEVSDAASKNDELRRRVNKDISAIWLRKTLQQKDKLREWALGSKKSFDTYLDLLRNAKPEPYDIEDDPAGELIWRHVAMSIATTNPKAIAKPKKLDRDGIAEVVGAIIAQFKFLIEERRLSEELYHDSKPRPEKSAQRIFFAVAYSYCHSNDLDVTPEADTGNGPVDFKISKGFNGRVLVEIKLSTNSHCVTGYTKQLEIYKGAEQTTRGFYVLINVGSLGKKAKQIETLKAAAEKAGKPASQFVVIDATRKPSASKVR